MGRPGKAKRNAPRASRSAGLPSNRLGTRGQSRFWVAGLLALAWFAIVVFRLFDLQVVQGRHLAEKANRQQVATVEIQARRGAILDRNGVDLALSTSAQSIAVFADRADDVGKLAKQLAGAVSVDAGALRERIRSGGFQWVKRLVTLPEAERARALGLGSDVLHFETESKRHYPHGTVAAHVLGTVGLDHYGQAGIEQRFETELSGSPGLGVYHYDARRRRYGRHVVRPAVAGADLLLDLDLEIQSLVHMELERAIAETKSSAGTIVLMRPDTGGIVAMSNWPRFDPNVLSKRPEDLENLRNFAVSHLVEPGSTFKVLTAAAALEEGLVTTADRFDCEMGGIWIGSRRIRDHKPFGLLTMPEVLINSSNVGIIKIGRRLGNQRLHEYIQRFGFGQATGVALPGEVAGLVRPVKRWNRSSWASLAMGQEIGVNAVQMARLFASVANGGILVNPRIVRALRSRRGVEMEFDKGPAQRVISAETAATLRAVLERVVSDGTGRLAQIQGYRVAGKTGTAQMINPVSRSYADGAYLASFCGIAPVNNPALVGVVMLYDPRGEFYYGGRIAAPLFANVMRRALRHLDVPPSQPAEPARPRGHRAAPGGMLADFVEGTSGGAGGAALLASVRKPVPAPLPSRPTRREEPAMQREELAAAPVLDSSGPDVPAGEDSVVREVPDMRGLTMREAFSLSASKGISIDPVGSGIVHEQSPEPGSSLAEGQVLRLRFGMAPVLSSGARKASEASGG